MMRRGLFVLYVFVLCSLDTGNSRVTAMPYTL